jgi:hypothetical protein
LGLDDGVQNVHVLRTALLQQRCNPHIHFEDGLAGVVISAVQRERMAMREGEEAKEEHGPSQVHPRGSSLVSDDVLLQVVEASRQQGILVSESLCRVLLVLARLLNKLALSA